MLASSRFEQWWSGNLHESSTKAWDAYGHRGPLAKHARDLSPRSYEHTMSTLKTYFDLQFTPISLWRQHPGAFGLPKGAGGPLAEARAGKSCASQRPGQHRTSAEPTTATERQRQQPATGPGACFDRAGVPRRGCSGRAQQETQLAASPMCLYDGYGRSAWWTI